MNAFGVSRKKGRLSAKESFYQGVDRFNANDLRGAESSFRAVLKIDPLSTHALNALGTVLYQLGRSSEAINAYRRCLKLEPSNHIAAYNLGNVLRSNGDLSGAMACYQSSCDVNRDFTPALQALGSLLLELDQIDKAEELLYRAATAVPPNPDASFNLGIIFQKRDKLDEAESWFKRALAEDAGHEQALNALGILLMRANRLTEAIACFERVIAINPDYWQAHNNLGSTLNWYGDLQRAEACYESVLRLNPNNGIAHYNLSLVLLGSGKFERGWQEYEWRFTKEEAPIPLLHTEIPRWQGENPSGRHILVYAEQGYGDTIQFSRYVKFLIERGATVSLECQDRTIAPLMERLSYPVRILSRGDEIPLVDYQIPLMSLPYVIGSETWLQPAPRSYIAPDEALILEWRRLLNSASGLKVGIAWAGRKEFANDHNRSLPVTTLSNLAGMEGVTFFSLQVGSQHDAAAHLDMVNHTSLIKTFADTAALMSNLDLVISIDSAPVHLAGAMGKPVWCLLPYNPDWRWMLDRSDSLLYPSMRLFRQEEPHGWDKVMVRVRTEIQSLR